MLCDHPAGHLIRSLGAACQGLSRSVAAAIELLGDALAGKVVSDRCSAHNHLSLEQRQLCWAHLIRDQFSIADPHGAKAASAAQLQGLQLLPDTGIQQHKALVLERSAMRHQACTSVVHGVQTTERINELTLKLQLRLCLPPFGDARAP